MATVSNVAIFCWEILSPCVPEAGILFKFCYFYSPEYYILIHMSYEVAKGWRPDVRRLTRASLAGTALLHDRPPEPFKHRPGDLVHPPVEVVHPFCDEGELLLLRGEALLQVVDGPLEPGGLLDPQFALPLEFLCHTDDPALLPGQCIPHHPEL